MVDFREITTAFKFTGVLIISLSTLTYMLSHWFEMCILCRHSNIQVAVCPCILIQLLTNTTESLSLIYCSCEAENLKEAVGNNSFNHRKAFSATCAYRTEQKQSSGNFTQCGPWGPEQTILSHLTSEVSFLQSGQYLKINEWKSSASKPGRQPGTVLCSV